MGPACKAHLKYKVSRYYCSVIDQHADRDSPEEIEVVKGPRQAKTNALQNQGECQYWFKYSKSHKIL